MKSFWIKLEGQSMSPLIKNGDKVYIENIESTEVLPGDVLYFKDQHSGEFTLHRLVEAPLVTKGDLSLMVEFNKSEVVIGKATKIKRGNEICNLNTGSSAWPKLFLFLSLLRMNKFLRKPSRLFMIIAACIFWRCNGKTMKNHNEELLTNDL